MSEIPTPDVGFEPAPTPKRKGCCGRTGIVCIAVIAVVVVGIIAATMFLGGPGYQTRIVDEFYNEDIELSDTTFYRDEFRVSSSETQTDIRPDLHFNIYVNTGSDDVSVTVHIAVYELDRSTFDSRIKKLGIKK